MNRHPPSTPYMTAWAACLLLCALSIPASVSAQAATIDVSQLPASVDCGSLLFPVNVSFTLSSPAYLSLYIYDPTVTSHPDTDNYGSLTSLSVQSSAVNYTVTLTLSTALQCYTPLLWAAILSSSSDATQYGAQLVVGLANVSGTGRPVGCSFQITSYTPDPPSVAETTWDYSILVTSPQEANIQLSMFGPSYLWYGDAWIPLGGAMIANTINETWNWAGISDRIPTPGTGMFFSWAIYPPGWQHSLRVDLRSARAASTQGTPQAALSGGSRR